MQCSALLDVVVVHVLHGLSWSTKWHAWCMFLSCYSSWWLSWYIHCMFSLHIVLCCFGMISCTRMVYSIASHLAVVIEMTCLEMLSLSFVCSCHPWCHIVEAHQWRVFSCNPPVYTRYCVTMSWAQFTRFHNAWLCCQAMCCICSVSAAQVVDDMLASHTPVHSWHGHRNDMLSAQYRCCRACALLYVFTTCVFWIIRATVFMKQKSAFVVKNVECGAIQTVCVFFFDVSWNNNLPWRKKTPAYSVNRSAHIQSEELIMCFLNPRFAL